LPKGVSIASKAIVPTAIRDIRDHLYLFPQQRICKKNRA